MDLVLQDKINLNSLVGEFDATVWAKEFVKEVEKNPFLPYDEETMICWFANAIMSGHDHGFRLGVEPRP